MAADRSRWESRSLYDVADYINGRPTKPSEVQPAGVPVIKIAELSGGISDRTDRVPHDAVQARHWVDAGDLLFAWSGSVGIHRYGGPRAALNQHIFRVVARNGVDQTFLRYLLQAQMPAFQAFVENKKTTMGHVTVRDLQRTHVLLPPLDEQRAIAHILGSLDDKIELNRRMAETLEAMARALFKSWFVDFDPVRAKAEGRDTGLPKAVADLFPDRFVDSELGEIPAGWIAGTLGDIAEHPRRQARPSELQEATPYIALEHMPRRSIAIGEWATAGAVASGKFRFERGEILFGKLRPYFHKVGVAPVDGVCSTDIVVVRARGYEWTAAVLGHVSSAAFVDYTNAGSTGTRMPRTSWAEMSRYPVALPPVEIAAELTSFVRPIVDRIVAGIHETRSLVSLRDTLLPKLVSGEIRVPARGSSEVPIEATA